ncbi:MAG TPA: ABC transporter substrate-binding protein [Ilumatobacteraceae bacterium]
MRRITFIAVLATVTATTAVTACNGGATDSDQPSSEPIVADTSNDDPSSASTTSVQSQADRIVSLSPSATEMLFAMGAGDQVVGVDDQSNYPADALSKPHDLSASSPDLDKLAALHPDLVVIADDAAGLSSQLAGRGIAVLIEPQPTSIDLVFDQIHDLGTVTGHVDEAGQVADGMRSAIDAAVAGRSKPSRPMTYYHELDADGTSITENTLTGQIYGLFGLQSIADFQEVSGDTPKLSADAIVSADPDFIFLADAETPATVSARPGWGKLHAVTDGNVVVLDDGISSRWGPRLVDFVQAIAAAIERAS